MNIVSKIVCAIYIYIYRISYTIYIGWYRKSTLCIHETHIQTHSNTVHNVTHKNIGNIIQIQVHYVWKIKKINFNWLQSTFSSSKFNMLFACFYDIRIFSKQNREKNCIHQRIFLFFLVSILKSFSFSFLFFCFWYSFSTFIRNSLGFWVSFFFSFRFFLSNFGFAVVALEEKISIEFSHTLTHPHTCTSI